MRIKIITSLKDFVKSFAYKNIFKDERLIKRFEVTIKEMFLSGNTLLSSISRNRLNKKVGFITQYINIQRFFNNVRWSYEKLRDKYIYFTSLLVRETQVIAFDFTEIIKPKGKAMEYISQVRDGRDEKIKLGYWANTAAIKVNGILTLLDFNIFSLAADGVKSKMDEMYKSMRKIYAVTKGKGIAVFDREFDIARFLQDILAEKIIKFVIRAKKLRDIIILPSGKKGNITELEKYFFKNKQNRMYVKENEEVYEIGYSKIHIENIGDMYMVVSRSMGNPNRKWFLYTNQKVTNYQNALKVIKQYTERWQIEVAIRTLKQEMKIENYRLRKYDSMKKMVLLSVMCVYIASKYLMKSGKKTLKYLSIQAELLTQDIKHFGIFQGIKNIFLEKLAPDEIRNLWEFS